MTKFDLKNKTVLITGATRGIGKAITKNFYDAGANLIITGTKQDGKNQLLESIEHLNNDQDISYFPVDSRYTEQVNSFIANLKLYDNIDICINNAGSNEIKMIQNNKKFLL